MTLAAFYSLTGRQKYNARFIDFDKHLLVKWLNTSQSMPIVYFAVKVVVILVCAYNGTAGRDLCSEFVKRMC